MKIHRMTRQRKIILEELKKVTSHPTADEIYLMVKRKIPNISLGTVYRNLKLLKNSGQVLEIHCGNFSRFNGNTMLHPHFTCRNCGKIFDVKHPIDLKFNKKLLSKNFSVSGFNIEFFGYCKDCRR